MKSVRSILGVIGLMILNYGCRDYLFDVMQDNDHWVDSIVERN